MYYFVGGLFAILLHIFRVQALSGQQFSCQDRPSGYYADINAGCQVYHMCDGLGRQFSYTCPNATLFQQRMLICDHWYMVNCSKSEHDYSANLLIGQKDKPFVEDTEKQRTPRPDLLTNPSEYEYNFYSQKDKIISSANYNKIVGVDTEQKQDGGAVSTDKPLYFVPSHWSTEFAKGVTEAAIIKTDRFEGVKQKPKGFSKTTYGENQRNNIRNQNYNDELNLVNNFENKRRNNNIKKPQGFKIKGSPNSPPVNFPSNYENTTPKFPTFVNEDDKKFVDIEEKTSYENKNKINVVLEPPKDPNSNKKREYMPEKKYTTQNLSMKTKQNVPEYSWPELRKKFFIPDIVFPLEMVPRPNYNKAANSFQVKSLPVFVTNSTRTKQTV